MGQARPGHIFHVMGQFDCVKYLHVTRHHHHISLVVRWCTNDSLAEKLNFFLIRKSRFFFWPVWIGWSFGPVSHCVCKMLSVHKARICVCMVWEHRQDNWKWAHGVTSLRAKNVELKRQNQLTQHKTNWIVKSELILAMKWKIRARPRCEQESSETIRIQCACRSIDWFTCVKKFLRNKCTFHYAHRPYLL